jgi:hypothetical protein
MCSGGRSTFLEFTNRILNIMFYGNQVFSASPVLHSVTFFGCSNFPQAQTTSYIPSAIRVKAQSF